MIATAVMFCVCALASWLKPEAIELFGAAGLITVFTFVSRVWSANSEMPWSAALWPPQDAICFMFAWVMWLRQREWWKLGLAICFAIQTARHVPYWWGVFIEGGPSWSQTNDYLWSINPLFAVELLILTVAGGGYVAGYVLDRVRVLWADHLGDGAIPAGRR